MLTFDQRQNKGKGNREILTKISHLVQKFGGKEKENDGVFQESQEDEERKQMLESLGIERKSQMETY